MLWSDVNPCSVIIMSGNVKSRVYCAVAQCRNYGFKSTGVMYHRFPRNDELKCLWISRCKRTNKFNTDNSRICSVHFLPTDYLRDLKNELLGLPTKKILRPDAVPSQFIPNWHGGFTTEGPGTTETASQVSEIMEEPPFIKCEPEWLSDVGEHLASDTAGNKVDIKIEPADEIDNLTGGEKNEDVVKDEPEFQETYLRVTSDNVCDIELKPDMKHFVLKEENTCTGSYENEEVTEGRGIVDSTQSNAELKRSSLSPLGTTAATCSTRMYACEVCQKMFVSLAGLRRHNVVHLEDRSHYCPHCGRKFTQKWNFKKHVASHSTVRPFACSFCERTFAWEPYLKRHIKQHSTDKPHKCNICFKSFHTNVLLKSHLLNIHSKEKKYPCTHCELKFAQRCKLAKHLLTHTSDKPFLCNQCGRRYTRGDTLRAHLLTHSGKEPFACNECDKTFWRRKNLSQHIYLHTGEKRKHVCPECDKDFSYKSQLSRHMSKHAGKLHLNTHCEEK